MIRRLRLPLAGSLIGGFMIWASGCSQGTCPNKSRLGFRAHPARHGATVCEPYEPPIRVQIWTNCFLRSNEAVTLSLGANPGGATLSGTLTVNAHYGVASFNDLTIDKAGSGYTLTATADGFDSFTSNAFDVR